MRPSPGRQESQKRRQTTVPRTGRLHGGRDGQNHCSSMTHAVTGSEPLNASDRPKTDQVQTPLAPWPISLEECIYATISFNPHSKDGFTPISQMKKPRLREVSAACQRVHDSDAWHSHRVHLPPMPEQRRAILRKPGLIEDSGGASLPTRAGPRQAVGAAQTKPCK